MTSLDDVPDRVTASALSALLLLHVLVVVVHEMCWPGGKGSHRDLCSAFARSIRDMVERVRRWTTQRDDQPGPEATDCILSALVADALRAKRQGFVRSMGKGISIQTGIMLLSILLNTLLQVPRWTTLEQTLIVSALYPIAWFVSLSEPSRMSLRCVVFVQHLGIGAFVATCFPQVDLAIISMVICAFPRFLINMFTMDLWLVCHANAVCSAFVLFGCLRLEDAPSGMLTRTHVLYLEAVFSVTTCMGAKAFRDVIQRSCRQALELQSSRNESLAAVGVLKAVCDAVVRLDDEMLVADEETKLAALLLHGPGRVLTGFEFLQYLSTVDQQQLFREWLRAPVGVGSEKGAFETTLRDSTGNTIRVDLFHVPYEYFPGILHHFIGIQERGNGGAAEDRAGHHLVSIRQRGRGARPARPRTEGHPREGQRQRGPRTGTARAATERAGATTEGQDTFHSSDAEGSNDSLASDAASGAGKDDVILEDEVIESRSVKSKRTDGASTGIQDTIPVQLSNTDGNNDSLVVDVACCLNDDQMIHGVQEIDSNPVFKFNPAIFKVLGHSDGLSIGPYGPPRRGSFLSDRMKKCAVNTSFFRDCETNVSRLCRRAGTTTDPVDVEYASTMIFTPMGSRNDFRLTLRIILKASPATGVRADDTRRRSPDVVGTAVVLAVHMETWGNGSLDNRSPGNGSPRCSHAGSVNSGTSLSSSVNSLSL